MHDRLTFHEILCGILGNRNVYFQPPESVRMQYPAIVYSRNRENDRFADDRRYTKRRSYSVTLIDKDPDSPVIENLLGLSYSTFDRHYVSENLNHDVFTIYY